MAWELEGLIAGLLLLISCAGEQGCPLSELLDSLQHQSSSPNHARHNRGNDPRYAESATEGRTASIIWKWLVTRRDISVGPDRFYNHLTLDDLLSQHPMSASVETTVAPSHATAEALETTTADSAIQVTGSIQVYASEETMWESLTGHAVDYKRVPRSEWLLLMGIASTKSEGILQGDLGRLVDQDKRSVPKRTDALVRKGYITKRTTLVRGTKTSKMWLRQFAPPLPKDADITGEPRAEMNFTRQVLIANLDPVPWHTRWTGESVDYTALATTILAVSKEWGVLRMQDLKAKLGVLGLRWQMKVLAKVCRFLNSRGVIQYVAAKLGDKVFKDCIKFGRDLNSEDWSAYLATGKRTSKVSRTTDPNTEGFEGGEQPFGQNTNASEVCSFPPWSVDKPLPVTIAEMAWRFGDGGLTNPDVYALTLGPSFSRYLSSMTTAISLPGLQPARLQHLQLRSEHTRVGKIASYRYFAQQLCLPPSGAPDTTKANATGPKPGQNYGFASISAGLLADPVPFTLSNLCCIGQALRKPRGRPRKTKPVGRVNQLPFDMGGSREISEKDSAPAKACEPHAKIRAPLTITLKVSAEALRTLLEQANEQGPVASTSRPRRTRGKRQTLDNTETDTFPTASGEESDASVKTTAPKKRGRGRQQNKSKEIDAGTRPWKCEKCGGSWKNDIGLKYHLEKSRTPCNPSYKQSVEEPAHRNKRLATTLAQLHLSSEPVVVISSSREPVGDEIQEAQHQKWPSEPKVSKEAPGSPLRPRLPTNGPGLSRLFNGLTGGLIQSTPEWRRPAAAESNKADGAPASVDGSSALLHDEDSRPRQVLTTVSLHSLHSGYQSKDPGELSSNKDVYKNATFECSEDSYPSLVAEDLREISLEGSSQASPGVLMSKNTETRSLIDPSLRSCEGTKPELGSGSEAPLSEQQQQDTISPSTTDVNRQVTRTAPKAQIGQVIQSILFEQNGAFPGGRVLWNAFLARWHVSFSAQKAPTLRQFNMTLGELLRNKSVSEHWHAFRDQKGMFSKCQVVVQQGRNPFSAEVMELVDMIKEAFPQPYFPPPFTELADLTPKDTRRGRRVLPSAVETLDAPVYVAQVAAKRPLDIIDDDSPAPKRVKRLQGAIKKSRSSVNLSPDHGRAPLDWSMREKGGSTALYAGNDYFDPLPAQEPLEDIYFLAPNTYMDEDAPEFLHRTPGAWAKEASSKQQNQHLPLSQQLPESIAFRPTMQVWGHNGSWPYLRTQDFEDEDASYTLCGWMPDLQWFSLSTIIQAMEKRAMAPGSTARSRNRVDGRHYHLFIDKLAACLEIELAWPEYFSGAPHRTAGPHNLFIRFLCQSPSDDIEVPPLAWPASEQLTLGSDFAAIASPANESDDGFRAPSLYRQNFIRHMKLELPRGETTFQPSKLFPQPSYTQSIKIKRVALKTRTLTALPPSQDGLEEQPDPRKPSHAIRDPERVLAAFVAARVLLGGSDKTIDWGLLVHIFPDIGIKSLRRFWITARKAQAPIIAEMSKDFQERFLAAYEKDEVSEIDFDNPLDYDWHDLIEWMMQLPRQKGLHIPSSRSLLHKGFDFDDASRLEDDSQDKLFHVQSSVFARFEAATSTSAAVAIDEVPRTIHQGVEITELVVAKSWIKSLCCTAETKYSVQQIKEKFYTLADGDGQRNTMLLKKAIEDLTRQRVICKSKRPPLGGRPYRLNEWYTYMLKKLSQRAKYREAAMFKAKLDTAFRRGERFMVPYTLDDGSVMALTNLNGSGRIRIEPVDVPHIPYGFEPGNYESRKYPKSYYHFAMEVVPSETYLYDEDIDVLQAIAREGPPLAGSQGELPQWIDFFGKQNPRTWTDVLGAFCFTYATRGPMTVEGACSALRPILEEYEAQMMLDWGRKTGVLKHVLDGMCITVGEWWWLAVPFQLK